MPAMEIQRKANFHLLSLYQEAAAFKSRIQETWQKTGRNLKGHNRSSITKRANALYNDSNAAAILVQHTPKLENKIQFAIRSFETIRYLQKMDASPDLLHAAVTIITFETWAKSITDPLALSERRRQTLLRLHADKNFSEIQKDGIKKSYKDPKRMQKHIDGIKERFKDPEFREKHSIKVREGQLKLRQENLEYAASKNMQLAQINNDPKLTEKRL